MTDKRKKLVKTDTFFFGAGSMYKWTDDGHHIHGFSVPRGYFNYPEIDVEIEGKEYTLDMVKAMTFVKKYKAIKQMKYEKCGVVSRSLLVPKETSELDEQFAADVEWFDNELE